jgi:hypothetical protein
MKKKTTSRSVNSNVLFGPPPILAGEEETAYDELIGRIYAAIKPVDVIDEMLIADAVASEWESAGSNLGLPIIGKLLRHRRAETTSRYAHISADPLKTAADAIAAKLAAKMGGAGCCGEGRRQNHWGRF